MGDYCDGELFKQHPLFKDDPCALQIRLYYDDLEMCNALGSKNKKHKLGNVSIIEAIDAYILLHNIGLFYYTLGNIEPKFRSTTHTIQLLTVVRTVLIDKYGINEILKPFVKEITQLESVSKLILSVMYNYGITSIRMLGCLYSLMEA